MRRRTRRLLVQALLLAALLAAAGVIALAAVDHFRDRTIEQRIDRHAATIERCAAEFRLPAELIRSVIGAESSGRPDAVSRVGARGLMQLRPPAEEDALRRLRLDRGDLFEPDYNIRIGCCYLRLMLDRFDGDVYLALAAYNLGPAAVSRWRRENPRVSGRDLVTRLAPKVTREYCRKIIRDRWETLPAS